MHAAGTTLSEKMTLRAAAFFISSLIFRHDTGTGKVGITTQTGAQQPPATGAGDHAAHPSGTQKSADPHAGDEHAAGGGGDIIMPHIENQNYLEFPWFNEEWAIHVNLPTGWIIRVGDFELDVSPTKHSVALLFAALLCGAVLIGSARSQAKRARETPQGARQRNRGHGPLHAQ
jgi:hypothetical protein